jgi:hypothetical protein
MPNRSNNALFQLIKSLKKSEKRNFKLFVKRNSAAEDLKVTQLFDALDKMDDYQEAVLLKKNPSISKSQLSNISANCYRQILSSLRLIKDEDNIDIQLHEQMDYARILYNKGLYIQSLNVLDKMKKLAVIHHQLTYLMQVLFFEKKIGSLYITRSIENRADELIAESNQVSEKLHSITRLSNLSLKLYGWYIKHGHARSTEDDATITKMVEDVMPPVETANSNFYEKLYRYQSLCWYAFIRQDFLMYYRYAQKWVDLFAAAPIMIEVETAHYIKEHAQFDGCPFWFAELQEAQGSFN